MGASQVKHTAKPQIFKFFEVTAEFQAAPENYIHYITLLLIRDNAATITTPHVIFSVSFFFFLDCILSVRGYKNITFHSLGNSTGAKQAFIARGILQSCLKAIMFKTIHFSWS